MFDGFFHSYELPDTQRWVDIFLGVLIGWLPIIYNQRTKIVEKWNTFWDDENYFYPGTIFTHEFYDYPDKNGNNVKACIRCHQTLDVISYESYMLQTNPFYCVVAEREFVMLC